MLKHLEAYTLILASQSPRRQQLLRHMGLNFRVQTKDGIPEDFPEQMPAEEVASYLSVQKARAYPELMQPGHLLITADTVVANQNRILNKPGSYREAFDMLAALSGSSHLVMTGVTLSTHQKRHSFTSTTKVFFETLDDAEIDYYIRHYKPYDKAGAYGIQEWIGYIGVRRIEGSYFNVMGLPMQELYQALKHRFA